MMEQVGEQEAYYYQSGVVNPSEGDGAAPRSTSYRVVGLANQSLNGDEQPQQDPLEEKCCGLKKRSWAWIGCLGFSAGVVIIGGLVVATVCLSVVAATQGGSNYNPNVL